MAHRQPKPHQSRSYRSEIPKRQYISISDHRPSTSPGHLERDNNINLHHQQRARQSPNARGFRNRLHRIPHRIPSRRIGCPRSGTGFPLSTSPQPDVQIRGLRRGIRLPAKPHHIHRLTARPRRRGAHIASTTGDQLLCESTLAGRDTTHTISQRAGGVIRSDCAPLHPIQSAQSQPS